MKISMTSSEERQLVQPVNMCVYMHVCMYVEKNKNAEV